MAMVMVTSILLCLGLMPAHGPLDADLCDARAEQGALSASPGEGRGSPCPVRVEAADQENEEEEWDDPALASHALAEIPDGHLILHARGSNGAPHLPVARDRPRLPRSPPRVGLLPTMLGLLPSNA